MAAKTLLLLFLVFSTSCKKTDESLVQSQQEMRCPTTFIRMQLQEMQGSLWKEDPQSCLMNRSTFKSTGDLISFLNSNRFTTIETYNRPLSMEELSSCIFRETSSGYKIPENGTENDLLQRAIISDYYYWMNAIARHVQGLQETIAGLDLLLKETPTLQQKNYAGRHSYSHPLVSRSQFWHRDLQTCTASSESTGQLLSTMIIELRQILFLRAMIASLSGYGRNGAELDKYKKSLEALLQASPYFQGDYLKSYTQLNVLTHLGVRVDATNPSQLALSISEKIIFGDSPESVQSSESSRKLYYQFKEAFFNQLRENRKRLTLKIDEAVDAAIAIHQPGHRIASGKDLKEYLQELPPFEPRDVFDSLSEDEKAQMEQLYGSSFDIDVQYFNELLQKSMQGRAIASMFYSSQCRNDVRKSNVDIYRSYRDLSIGIGVTVATAGLGSYAMALKNGVQAGKFATQSFGAAQATQRAQLISRALIGFDLSYAGFDLKMVAERCNQHVNQNITNFFALPVSETTPYCNQSQNPITGAASTKAIMATAVSNYRSCVIDAIFITAVNALPFTPEIMRIFRSHRI